MVEGDVQRGWCWDGSPQVVSGLRAEDAALAPAPLPAAAPHLFHGCSSPSFPLLFATLSTQSPFPASSLLPSPALSQGVRLPLTQGPLSLSFPLPGAGYREAHRDHRDQGWFEGCCQKPPPPPPSSDRFCSGSAPMMGGGGGRETPFPCSKANAGSRCLRARIEGGVGTPMSSPLPSEASCPICLEYFRDPVSIHCGHHFCRACISRCWEWATAPFSCPRCREPAPERTLLPSRELARVLEAARRLSSQAAPGDRCQKHQEPLKLLCQEDGAFLCAVCRESRAHRSHRMLPAQEALQGYKGQIQARLQALKEERDKLLGVREAEMRRSWEYLEKTTAERQRVLSKLEGLRLFLEDHAQHLLAQLGDLERDIEKLQEENVTSLTKEISRLDSFIQEMEEKSQQPATQFLQDIRGTLSRLEAENFQQPPLLLPELEKRISRFRARNTALEETLRSFQDILMFELPEKMKVTLDPSTAHPQLVVSADGRSVRWDKDAHQDPCAEGLGTDPCVLGTEGITTGRCCWEVEVAPEGSWALGVATEPLWRREEAAEGPGMELWSMGLCEGQFWALTSLERIPLYQGQVPTRVQVSLDYDRGQVAFFDADKRSLIFTFPAASFKGESVRPWFLVWGEGAHITLCP